jgi:hypothetical protein
MKFSKLMVATTLIIGTILGGSSKARAWAFYWSKVSVKTSSWNDCMAFATDIARKDHLGQIKRTNLDVSGNRNGAFATITCIGTGPNSNAMAVVMVVGDPDGPVRQLRDDLARDIQNIQRID